MAVAVLLRFLSSGKLSVNITFVVFRMSESADAGVNGTVVGV